MEYSNIHQIDREKLSMSDKMKLKDYEVVNYIDLKLHDHFRYTSNKYREKDRKLAYAVVFNNDKVMRVMEVNGYTTEDTHIYPNWKIEVDNQYKKYIFYKKKKEKKYHHPMN